MKRFVFFLMVFFNGPSSSFSQLAIGVEPFLRKSSDYITTTYGIGIGIDYKEDNFFYRTGFSVTMPVKFLGSATLHAKDSTTVPFTINVPIEQKITDYLLHFGFGAKLKSKNEQNYFVATFGIRGIFRNVKVRYTQKYDRNLYSDKSITRHPTIPAAIGIGWNVGLGYWYKHEKIILFPNISLGFGSGDNHNNHPWNDFPMYLEFGCRFLFTKASSRSN